MKKRTIARFTALFLMVILLAALLPARIPADEACRHAYSEEMQHMSSCRDPEADYYKCIYCGEWVNPETGHIFLGHNFVQGDVGMRPTCEQAAYYEIYCTLCGYKERHETDPALGHAWSEWTVTKAPTAVADGVRTRTCSRCGKQEQSGIPADPSLVSLSTLEVFILQQMLAEEGLYSGSIDGQYGPGTEAAARTFQQQNGLSQTDPAMTDTFTVLSNHFLDRHSFYEPGEYLAEYPCGLTVDPLTEKTCESNGDGTHTVTVTRVGLAFERAGQRKEIPTSDSYRSVLASYPEDCLVGNESHTCSRCGWKAWTDYSLGIGNIGLPKRLGDWTLYWDPVDANTPSIADLTWMPLDFTAKWSAFEGADSYEWILSRYDKSVKGFTDEASGYTPDTYVNLKQYLSDMEGIHQITVTAMAAGETISNPGTFQFTDSNRMLPVRDLRLENGQVSWKIDQAYALVVIYVRNGETDEPMGNVSVVGKTTVDILDMADAGNCKTYYVVAKVFSHADPNGGRLPSEEIKSETVKFEKPRYVQTSSSMNVRSGPGKNYERMGGLNKGEIVRVISEEDGFYKICYFGKEGWIMASCTAPAKKQVHTITLDPGEGQGNPITVKTDFNGRIDWPSTENWFCPGCSTCYFSRTKNGSSRVDDREVFTKDTTLYAIWERDPLLTYLTFIDENGDTEDAFWVYKGHDLHLFQYPDKGAIPPANQTRYWYTGPDGTGERVDLKYYIVPEDAPDSITLYATMAMLTELEIKGPVFLYEKPDTASLVLGELRNVRVTVLDVTPNEDFYHVQCPDHSHGYVPVSSVTFRTFFIRFDPNGGWCDVQVMYTDYRGFLKTRLPVPERDGYIFGGWADSSGKIYSDGMLQEEQRLTNLALKAVWIEEDGYSRQAVAVGRANTGASLYEEANAHEGYLTGSIPSGSLITVTAEKDGMYRAVTPGGTAWLAAEDVCFDYRAFTIFQVGEAADTVEIVNKPGSATVFEYHKIYAGTSETFYVVGEKGSWYRIAYDMKGTNMEEAWVHKRTFEETNPYRSVRQPDNTVVFNANGGSMGGRKTVTMELSVIGTLPENIPIPVRNGYTFTGWFTDPVCGSIVTVNSVFDRHTNLYAHWKGGEIGLYVVDSGNGIYTYKDYACKQKAEILDNGTCVYAEYLGGDLYSVRVNGVSRFVYDPKGTKLIEGERMIAYRNPRCSGKIRSEASTDGKKLGYLVYDQAYVVVDSENGYFRIAYDTGGKYENGFAYAPQNNFYKE